MRIYLIQHGQAKSKEEDPDRPLSEEGLAEVRKVAAFLQPLGLRVQAVWHSPKARAVQTAEAFAQAVVSEEGTVPRDDMNPKDDIDRVRKEIVRGEQDVMLVGHLPFLSRLAGKLLVGKASAEPVAFRYAGVVCLERVSGSDWQVAWMVTSELLPAAS